VISFADTNVLVRYLTADPPERFEVAKRILDEVNPLYIPAVILAETAFVLTSVYQVPRPEVVDELIAVLRKRNVSVPGLGKDVVITALLLCRPSGRVSFPDALLWASARSASPSDGGAAVIYSFDRRLPTEGVEVRSQP